MKEILHMFRLLAHVCNLKGGKHAADGAIKRKPSTKGRVVFYAGMAVRLMRALRAFWFRFLYPHPTVKCAPGATSHELLAQFIAEIKSNLVFINEQYQNKDPATALLHKIERMTLSEYRI